MLLGTTSDLHLNGYLEGVGIWDRALSGPEVRSVAEGGPSSARDGLVYDVAPGDEWTVVE